MGEPRAVVGDVGEAVVSVTGESGEPGGGVAHRGRLLNLNLDVAAGGVFDDLPGLVVEAVALQAATGQPQGG